MLLTYLLQGPIQRGGCILSDNIVVYCSATIISSQDNIAGHTFLYKLYVEQDKITKMRACIIIVSKVPDYDTRHMI